MRLTPRCIDILTLLRVARRLRTSQLRRRFFADTSLDAARKRLRVLANAGYLARIQPNRMAEALYALGPEGKRELERRGAPGIVMERGLPKNLEHLLGINDLRIAGELTGVLDYFFACWELPGLGWAQPIIPDAVLSLRGRVFAAEIDRGVEGVRYFLRTKVSVYTRGFDDLALTGVLVVADRPARMEALAEAIGRRGDRFLFATLDQVRSRSLAERIFVHAPGGEEVALA